MPMSVDEPIQHKPVNRWNAAILTMRTDWKGRTHASWQLDLGYLADDAPEGTDPTNVDVAGGELAEVEIDQYITPEIKAALAAAVYQASKDQGLIPDDATYYQP